MPSQITPADTCFVVLNYERPWNVPTIVNSAVEYGFGEVVIWNNNPDSGQLCEWLMKESPPGVSSYRIAGTVDGNKYTMGRYSAAIELGTRSVIATCDDDYVLTSNGWDRLFDAWDGESIVANAPDEQNRFASSGRLPYVNLGYGALFDIAWAREAFIAIDEITDSEERDILVRKADRCFTAFHQKRVIQKVQFGQHLIKMRNPDGSYSETDKHSIHLKQSHMQDTHRAVSFALQASLARA